MRLHINQILAAFALSLTVMTAHALAQPNLPFGPGNYSHDFQLFAPVEIDLDNEPMVDDHGYYAGYNKLAWSFSGEHVTVGDPDVLTFAEIIYYANPGLPDPNVGAPPLPYQVQNGLQNVIPDAGFALGDRYEIGYRDKGNGWSIGILDGPEMSQFKAYGMTTLDGYLPPVDPNYLGNPTAGDLFALGFGNVHVNFETPAGYLLGFRDYLNYLEDAFIGTQVGPIAYVGNYGGLQEPEGDDEDITLPFFRITDDINQNGVPGSIVVITIGPDGFPLLTTLTDFGDLHQFNIAFDQVQVRSRTKMNGVEAMWTHEMTNRHHMAKHQNNHVELGMGARFLQLKDYFGFLADGGILGRTFSDTQFNNNIVGPQVRAKWTNQRQRWRLSGTTSFMFGYNNQKWSQENGIGAELVPGAVNRLLYAQPTYSSHGLSFDQFSPVGELRLEAAYYLTQAFALKVGYTGMYVGNIKRASTSVRYYLPDMGYKNSGNQELISNGVDAGIEFVY
jgi:hypothetical protein